MTSARFSPFAKNMLLAVAGCLLVFVPMIGLAAETGSAACTGTSCNFTYTPLEPLPVGVAGGSGTDYGNLASYLNTLFPILITIGALFGVITFTISGVLYMTAADSGEAKSKATERMRAAVWGMVLLLASVLILQTINPTLVIFDLSNLSKVSTSDVSGSSAGSNSVGSSASTDATSHNISSSGALPQPIEISDSSQTTSSRALLFQSSCEQAGGVTNVSGTTMTCTR